MTAFIGDAPPQYVIRVTRGADIAFTLNRVDDTGAALDWDAAVYLDIDVGASPPTRVQATVTASQAAFYLDSTVCDQVSPMTAWRAIMSVPSGMTSHDTALIVGVFQRNDGQPSI